MSRLAKLLPWILCAAPAFAAASTVETTAGTQHAAPQAGEQSAAAISRQALSECMARIDPEFIVESVAPSGIPGLAEVSLEGGDFLYVGVNCRYLLAGSLYRIDGEQLVGITEQRRVAKRMALLDAIPDADMVTFTPDIPTEPRASIAVFTDTDCGYCRAMHQRMAEYHELGIEVRYLAYPRAGLGSASYDRMVAAWCADNPNEALTQLKNGGDIPPRSCDNPVAEHYKLGQQIGLTGTPTIILPEGEKLNGYVPPEQLAELLGL